MPSKKWAVIAVGEATAYSGMDIISDVLWDIDKLFSWLIESMLFSKGYNTKYLDVKSKPEFLSLINNPDNEIVYYSGHGAMPGPTERDTLVPSYTLDGIGYGDLPFKIPDYVDSSEIHSNARIVFLNSCNSMYYGSFKNSFGDAAENKVLMGWDRSIDYLKSTSFAFEWWRAMASKNGAGAKVTADKIDSGWYTTPSTTDPNKPNLVISGDGAAAL